MQHLRSRKLRVVGLSLVLLVSVVLILTHRSRVEAPLPPQAPAASAASLGGAPKPASPGNTSSSLAAHPSQASREASRLAPLTDFEVWFTALRRGQKASTPEGLALARARREAMKVLIRENPAEALARSLPRSLRQELPADIVAQLETPIDATGPLQVLVACGETWSSTSRQTELEGKHYEVFTYGRRLDSLSKDAVALNGIAIDGLLALSEQPYRRLEAPELEAAGLTPGADLAVLHGDIVRRFESEAALGAWAAQTLAGEANIGPGSKQTTTAADAAWVEGTKRVLWLRAEFSDDPGSPATDTEITTAMTQADAYFRDVSRGKTRFTTAIFPGVIRSAATKASVTTTADGQALSDDILKQARAYDAANGGTGLYNPDGYDRWILVFKQVGVFYWAGLAQIGAKSLWLNGTTAPGVVAHELGHNQGLSHSHAWKPTTSSPLRPGEHVEYGDPFDVMGDSASIPSGHFNTSQKRTLGYLAASEVQQVSSGGTVRIKRSDSGSASGVQAAQLAMGSAYDYWLELRQDTSYLAKASPANVSRLKNGILVHWGKRPAFTSGTGTYLLDATPLTAAGMMDAPLALGESFVDPDYGLAITPTAVGGSSPDEYIDVQVSFGATGGNHDPVLSFSAPATSLQARTDIEFSASGSDPDGDTVYYRWDFGDGLISPTTSRVTHRWSKGGTYTVSCAALDGKGGLAQKSITVTVTDPLVSWVRRSEGLSSADLHGVLFAGGQFVAAGWSSTLLVSGDGISWTKSPASFPNTNFNAITYGAGTYVAVGLRYDFTTQTWISCAASSTDGLRWTDRSSGMKGGVLNAVAWSGAAFVAAGEGGTLYRSTDGATWTSIVSGTTKHLNALRYAEGRFVAAGDTGLILTSSDGTTWSNRSVVTSESFYGVSRFKGTWWATNGYTTYTSADAQTWSSSTNGLGGIAGPFIESGSALALNAYGSSVRFSEDWASWETVSLASLGSGLSLRSLAQGNGGFVAVGLSGMILQSGTPQYTAPRFANASLLAKGVVPGGQVAVTASSTGFTKVQLLVDGSVVSEKTGDNPAFTWTPQRFGAYMLSLSGVDSGGNALLSSQLVRVSLGDWQWLCPSPSGATLRSVTPFKGAWYAAGDEGTLLRSSDALTWSVVPFASRMGINGLASDGNRLILCGTSYDYVEDAFTSPLWTSTDGSNWEQLATPKRSSVYAVSYAGGVWVAAGYTVLWRSTDGLTWTAQSTPLSTTYYGVANGGGLWVAVGINGVIVTSPDAITWTRQSSPVTSSLAAVARINGKWAAAGSAGVILSSADGITWSTASTGVSNELYAMTEFSGQFLVSGSQGTLLLSTDGQVWTKQTLAQKSTYIGLGVQAGRLVAVGSAGEIGTGTALSAWSPLLTTKRPQAIRGLSVSSGNIIAATDSIDGLAIQWLAPVLSYDATLGWKVWGSGPSSTIRLNGIAAAGHSYLAVGESGQIFGSPDGSAWTSRSSGTATALNAVAFGSSQSVAVGNAGTILSSPDGSAWTSRSSGSTQPLRGVCFGNGRFIAVGGAGAILSSSDGLTWVPQSSGTTASFNAVGWSQSLGYVAVGNSGTVALSPDGASWTLKSTGSTDSLDTLALLSGGIVAGNGSRLLISGNGTDWSTVSTGAAGGAALTALTAGEGYLWAAGSQGRLARSPLAAIDWPVSINTQPSNASVNAGGQLTLTVGATGGGALAYQWYRNGVAISGASSASYTLASVQPADSGVYSVVVSNAAGSTTSSNATLVVNSTSFTNFSMLTLCEEGGTISAGFVIDGNSGTERVLVRAIGPGISAYFPSDHLRDPKLKLSNQQTGALIASNDNWSDNATEAAALNTSFSSTYAFALAAGSKDAALLVDLPNGLYTAEASSAIAGASGQVIVEVYRVSSMGAVKFINVSTLKNVPAGGKMSSGFVIDGTGTQQVLVRAAGPALASYFPTDFMADPKLVLLNQQTGAVLGSNDDWSAITTEATALLAAFNTTQAFPLVTGSKDAALLATLPPGLYTVEASSSSSTAGGRVILEVYLVK